MRMPKAGGGVPRGCPGGAHDRREGRREEAILKVLKVFGKLLDQSRQVG